LGEVKAILSNKQFRGNLLDSSVQLQLIKRLAARLIGHTGMRLLAEQQKQNKLAAWNECMHDLVQCSKIHCEYYVLESFVEVIKDLEVSNNGLSKMLKKLCDLYALDTIEKYFGYLVEDGYFSAQNVKVLHEQIRVLCKEIRNDAVPLVDAFNIPDFVLNSALGRHDGDVYKNYLAIVKKAPGAVGVPSYYEEQIKPLLKRGESNK